MQKTIKSIPTEYDGIMYKSKLEAKWALFFDLINIQHWYEGVQWLGDDGATYTPDFMILNGISRGDTNHLKYPFIEIKPIAPSANFLRKVLNARDISKSDLFICVGEPSFYQPNGIWITTSLVANTSLSVDGFMFHRCPDCGVYTPDVLYDGVPIAGESTCGCSIFPKPKEWKEAAEYVKFHRFDI